MWPLRASSVASRLAMSSESSESQVIANLSCGVSSPRAFLSYLQSGILSVCIAMPASSLTSPGIG